MSRSVPKMCCKSRERRGPGAGVTDRPTDRYPPEERISADATTLSLLFFCFGPSFACSFDRIQYGMYWTVASGGGGGGSIISALHKRARTTRDAVVNEPDERRRRWATAPASGRGGEREREIFQSVLLMRLDVRSLVFITQLTAARASERGVPWRAIRIRNS